MKNLIILFLTILFLTACEKELDIKPEEYKSKLVVNCLFNETGPFTFQVSNSLSILDNTRPTEFGDAVIELYEDGVKIEIVPFVAAANKYVSTIKPKPEKNYGIRVAKSGYTQVEASGKLPSVVPFTFVSFKDSTILDKDNNYFGELTLRFNDPAVNNFYGFRLEYWSDVSMQYELLYDKETLDPSLTNSEAFTTNDGTIYFKDVLFNGKVKEILFKIPAGYYTTTPNFRVSLYSLGFDYFNYSVSSAQAAARGGFSLFSEPAQVHNNIKDGIGIFAGFSLDADTIK